MKNDNTEDPSAKVRAVFGDTVDVKQISVPVSEDSENEVVDLITRVCYFYPQYTLKTAEKLTNSQVNALLLQAEKQRAIEFYNLTLIASSPHTKKGKLVETLTKQYKKIAEL